MRSRSQPRPRKTEARRGVVTYDHLAYLKAGTSFDLDRLAALMATLPDAGMVAIRHEAYGLSEGYAPPTLAERLRYKLMGRTGPMEMLERIMTQPAVVAEHNRVILRACFSEAPHVAEEAREIAEMDGLDMGGATRRMEFHGVDPDLELNAFYTQLMDALHDDGGFVLYSGQTGLWERT